VFPHPNICKFAWKSPDGKTQNEIESTSIDWSLRTIVFAVRFFRGVDFDADQCLAVAKVKNRRVVSKQILHRFHTDRFNLKK
jgi:hypothetical protein